MSLAATLSCVTVVALLSGASLALWLMFADEVTLAYMADLAMRCF